MTFPPPEARHALLVCGVPERLTGDGEPLRTTQLGAGLHDDTESGPSIDVTPVVRCTPGGPVSGQ
jgi:hypothetical protein